jgi:putative salt-induced outer membrane protein YdiY
MNPNLIQRGLVALVCATALVAELAADVVETKNGARIVGKVVRISEGAISVETDYAGMLAIKQSEVVSVTTDAPVAVRLASGTRMDGKVTGAPDGTLTIVGSDGTITTTVGKVAASWTAGSKDPEIAAMERHWAYEAAVDVTGRNGNKDQLGTAASLRAVLKTMQDTLQFYTAYDRQETDGLKSADQFKAGVDYQNNFAGKRSWYVRDEGGFDRVKDIDLYNVAAAGFGYDLIRQPKHVLTARAGLSYRYEGYNNPLTEDVRSAGLDFGIAHELTLANAKLVNRLSYVPAFDDFGNYRANHESFFEIPLTAPSWKLRFGVSNDYNSQPGVGVEKMDTSYFTRLVLSWR